MLIIEALCKTLGEEGSGHPYKWPVLWVIGCWRGEVIHLCVFVTEYSLYCLDGYTVGEYFPLLIDLKIYDVLNSEVPNRKLRKMCDSPYSINLADHKLHKLLSL